MPLIAVDSRNRRAVIAGGLRGPAGRDGVAGGQSETLVAGAALSGHRAVIASGGSAYYASADSPQTAAQTVGVTTQAADAGAPVTVQRFGRLVELTWSWVPGPVYLGLAGALTQTAPETGVYLQIGVALDATTLDIRIGTPVELE